MTLMILWAVLLLIATWFDWWTTTKGINAGAREANPIVRWIVDQIGWAATLYTQIILLQGLVWFCYFAISTQVAWGVAIGMTLLQGWLGYHNIKVRKKIERRKNG